jgi:hypothetical protein
MKDAEFWRVVVLQAASASWDNAGVDAMSVLETVDVSFADAAEKKGTDSNSTSSTLVRARAALEAFSMDVLSSCLFLGAVNVFSPNGSGSLWLVR